MAKVTLYYADYCPFCRNARALLERKAVDYELVDVMAEPARRQEMEQRSQRHTIPQIFIGDQHVGGCDELYALEQQNRLDDMLAAA